MELYDFINLYSRKLLRSGFSFRFRGPGVGERYRSESRFNATFVTVSGRPSPRLEPVDFDALVRCSGGLGFPSVAYTVQI